MRDWMWRKSLRGCFSGIAGCAALRAIACTACREPATGTSAGELGSATMSMPPTAPVGLALEIEGGQGAPLTLRAGHVYDIDQIDLRTAVTSAVDQGL